MLYLLLNLDISSLTVGILKSRSIDECITEIYLSRYKYKYSVC